jgi:hypothetical protein
MDSIITYVAGMTLCCAYMEPTAELIAIVGFVYMFIVPVISSLLNFINDLLTSFSLFEYFMDVKDTPEYSRKSVFYPKDDLRRSTTPRDFILKFFHQHKKCKVTFCLFRFGGLSSGPLADYVFEPMLDSPEGVLANTFIGKNLGVGKGMGIRLFWILMGISMMILSLLALSIPRLVNLETEIPDVETKHPDTKTE